MVNIVSPGVYILEKDISEYAPTVNSSVVGVVGFADRGSSGAAKLITSQERLIQEFGQPAEHITGQGLEGVMEILEDTTTLYFVRAIDSGTAADASANLQFGGCPAIAVSGKGLGVASAVYLKVNGTDNNGVSSFTALKSYAVPAGTLDSANASSTQGGAFAKVLGGNLDSDKVGAFYDSTTAASGFLVGLHAGTGATIHVQAFEDSAYTTKMDCLVPLTASGGTVPDGGSQDPYAFSEVIASGFNIDVNTAAYHAKSLYPGAGYNGGVKSDGAASGIKLEVNALGGANTQLQVNDAGVVAESYKQTCLSGANFWEGILNTYGVGGNLSTKSDIIRAYVASGATSGNVDLATNAASNFVDKANGILGYTLQDAGGQRGGVTADQTITEQMNPRFLKLMQQTVDMDGGNSGIPTSDDDITTTIVGTVLADGTKTGIQALDDQSLNIGIALTPGIHQQSIQNALISKAEETTDFMAVVSPPAAIGTAQNAINWSNGQSLTRSAAINSSYAAIYWPWVKVFDVFSGQDRLMDPAIFGTKAMLKTDSVAETWFAPAGFQRGRLNKPTEVEVLLTKGERDSMYSGGNVVNPIVKFPQQGITIFGQRTSQRSPTALDRINVRRLMIYLKKVIFAATQRFVFEPNDEFTWARVEEVLIPFISDIKDRRGITDFRVVCDATTNTATRIDRNELWCKVLIKPTKTAEMMVFEINLTNQAAKLGSL